MKQTHILWSSIEAGVITGGRNTCEWRASGIALNAREVKPGDLFFAAASDDLEEVFRNGAAAAVVPRNAAERPGWPMLKVADPYEALLALARAARFKTHAYVVSVQGQEARRTVERMLGSVFSAHGGFRNFSQGLAAMPENCDFAVFGFSPLVRPDIAIITDCANVDGSVFESMPSSGRVLIDGDSEASLEVIARARAAGIRNIFTFGKSQDADAALLDVLYAYNGARARLKVMSEVFEAVLPAGASLKPETLAAALIMRLSEASLTRIGQVLESEGNRIPGFTAGNLALLDSSCRYPVHTAFRVSNMIDLGRGRRTAVLDNIAASPDCARASGGDLAIPSKLDNLDLVFAGKGLYLYPDAENAIRQGRPAASLEKIASSALAPGDFVTFEGFVRGSKKLMASALRMIGPMTRKPVKA